MSEQTKDVDEKRGDGANGGDPARDNQDNEIEAEQESAAAMDADVPQPEDTDVPQPKDVDKTTEGQPS